MTRLTAPTIPLICILLWPLSIAAQTTPRVPILIDTDVGAEIDDTFALALVLGSGELELRGITTVGDDTRQKAQLLCRFLTATGRRNIRVAAGAAPQPARPLTQLFKYYYHPSALFNPTMQPEQQGAADFLYERLKQSPGVTIVSLGPLTNIAQLLEAHNDAVPMIGRLVLLESNLVLDVDAASKVLSSGIPLLVIPTAACRDLRLDDQQVAHVFRPGTALTRQVQSMYQMWDSHRPPLGESLAVSLCFDQSLVDVEERLLTLDESGKLDASKTGGANAQLVLSIRTTRYCDWYAQRMGALRAPVDRPSQLLTDGRMPQRVHVVEDFDDDIERFWWMSGKPESELVPHGSVRACRGVLTHDFDNLLMASRQMYSAVIFNPVPGPPMAGNTRLSFRYWLSGTDTIRVQIYSLSNGYHRHLVVNGLPQQSWQHAVVDMTDARRPDGTGGPLSENERIDDIQFYVQPDAEIVIDDVVLYEAAEQGEQRSFPRRIQFTGWFDTGKHGEHWLGDFEIVADAGSFWRACRSIVNEQTGEPWIRLQLKGPKRLADTTHLSFRYRLTGTQELRVRLRNTSTGRSQTIDAQRLAIGEWAPTTIEFATRELQTADEIQFLLAKDSDLLVDDVLLFEPAPRTE